MESIHYPSKKDWKFWLFNPAAVAEEAEHNRRYHLEGVLQSVEDSIHAGFRQGGYILRILTDPASPRVGDEAGLVRAWIPYDEGSSTVATLDRGDKVSVTGALTLEGGGLLLEECRFVSPRERGTQAT